MWKVVLRREQHKLTNNNNSKRQFGDPLQNRGLEKLDELLEEPDKKKKKKRRQKIM